MSVEPSNEDVETMKQLCRGPVHKDKMLHKESVQKFIDRGWVELYRNFGYLTRRGVDTAIELGYIRSDDSRHQWFKLVQDDSGHDFVVPVEETENFYDWLEKLTGYTEDEDFDFDKYESIGGPIVFSDWKPVNGKA